MYKKETANSVCIRRKTVWPQNHESICTVPWRFIAILLCIKGKKKRQTFAVCFVPHTHKKGTVQESFSPQVEQQHDTNITTNGLPRATKAAELYPTLDRRKKIVYEAFVWPFVILRRTNIVLHSASHSSSQPMSGRIRIPLCTKQMFLNWPTPKRQ